MGQSEFCIYMLTWKRTRDWDDDELSLLIVLGRGYIKAEPAFNLFIIELSRQNFVKDQQRRHVQMKDLFDCDAYGTQGRLWNWEDFSVLDHELLLKNCSFGLAR